MTIGRSSRTRRSSQTGSDAAGARAASPTRALGHAQSVPAILGWNLYAIEALYRQGREFFVVADPANGDYARANGVPFVPCDSSTFDASRAHGLALELRRLGVDYAVPLYEPTVEWWGAVSAILLDRPKLAEWAQLFRDKAMMKRRAQLNDISVGVFREVNTRDELRRFLAHVNQALLSHEPVIPIHVKAFDEAGCKGHYLIDSFDGIDDVPDEAFPCLAESHLEGQEIACEVWVHDGEIVFMNISEYVHLGHSVFVPPGPELERRRDDIRRVNQQLIDAFEVESGILHPEWFMAEDGAIYFGEVAFRVPGGQAFELIERAYGFDPYYAQILCMDPHAARDDVRDYFPPEDRYRGHSGVLLVYPEPGHVSRVEVPRGLTIDPAFEGHDLLPPGEQDVERPDRFVNGTHWGHVYFFSDDADRIRRLCRRYERHAFYR